MRGMRWLAVFFIAMALGSTLLLASGPAGCYAIVQKVVMEPNDTAPKRIQIWGFFSLADGKSGNGYLPPQRGYLYFAMQPGQDQVTLAEWSDLKKVAGTDSVITFAERPSWGGHVRKPTDKPDSPDPYPVYNGITRVVTGRGLGSIDNPAVVEQLKKALKSNT